MLRRLAARQEEVEEAQRRLAAARAKEAEERRRGEERRVERAHRGRCTAGELGRALSGPSTGGVDGRPPLFCKLVE